MALTKEGKYCILKMETIINNLRRIKCREKEVGGKEDYGVEGAG